MHIIYFYYYCNFFLRFEQNILRVVINMLYKTHLEIGENTLNTIEGRGRNLIDKKVF